MLKFMLGAYWNERREGVEGCAQRAWQFFAHLSEIDPLLTAWYDLGWSRKDALERKVDTSDSQKLQELLIKGRNRRDIGGDVIEDLGYRLSLWNGANAEDAEAAVRIHCGCYSERVGNSVIIDLPYRSENLAWVEKASSLLRLVVETWRPKWAGIMSKKAMRERNFDGDQPFVDWIVYVPRSVASIPPPGRIEVLDGLGSIVIVQPSPLQVIGPMSCSISVKLRP